MLLYLCIFYGVYRYNKADFDAFNRARIGGTLLALKTQNHGVAVVFTLSTNRHYRFFPSKEQGGSARFMALAALGDSIRKKPWSDTLLLIKKGPPRQLIRYKCDQVLY